MGAGTISEAPGLIVPAKVADSSAGQRLMFTVRMPNVDEVCGKLKTLAKHNLHVPLDDMGIVESIHLTVFHWVLDHLHARISP